MRRQTRQVKAGSLLIGGGAPISIQSMTNTDTGDAEATLKQIAELEEAGCELIRVAVPDRRAVEALPAIRAGCRIPLAADIHFDDRLAIDSIRAGVDKVRINPGNLGGPERLLKVAETAARHGVALRVGINAGSLEKHLLARYGGPVPEALAASALENTRLLEREGFTRVVVSLKSSGVRETIAACRAFAAESDLPLHLGVTEAGTPFAGTVKSAIGIGCLLAEGIGDTLRVSLTGPPREEIRVGKQILLALGLQAEGVDLVSCPTCGRCRVDLVAIAEQVERAVVGIRKKLKVAVMGCEVNGPGEARDADIGLAGGDGCLLLFIHGKPVRKVTPENAVRELLKEMEKL